jgi:hypothetical protein
MTRLETIMQLLKIAMMLVFLGIFAWFMYTGGIPVRVVG